MLFDTDVFIWIQRGNLKAASAINAATDRYLSAQTYMELLQGAQNKAQQRIVKRFVSDLGFVTLPLTENIGHRALIYIEEYGISSGLRAGDAIIAATTRPPQPDSIARPSCRADRPWERARTPRPEASDEPTPPQTPDAHWQPTLADRGGCSR